ncbi:hypothetical protein [Candidatus Pelagibacter sp. HIMB1748]|uniref:hypothetical protein n=1 Tax=unclassified Candidatus Pelagibacter TaxID=2647897 RepID=UPI003F85E27C
MNFIKKISEIIISKIANKFFSNKFFKRKFDDLKLQNGQIFSFYLKTKINSIKNLDEISFKVFSQNNEDAILEFLILSLKLKNIKFIEIGTENYSESNTRFIYEKYNCDGLIVDNTSDLIKEVSKQLDVWKGNLSIEERFVNSENINVLINKHFPNKNIDIFSIDIDGIDYWILKQLPDNISKIIVAEYNPYFGPELEITVPYSENFNRTKYHPSNLCWGMSLRALINLMKDKGFNFIGSNSLRNNAFFVKNDFINLLPLDSINTSDLENFTNARFRENKSKTNKLGFNSPEKNLTTIQDCEVLNLKDGKIYKIKELIEKI